MIRRLAPERRQRLAREAIDRALVRRAVHADVGTVAAHSSSHASKAAQLRKAATRQGIPLHVFHAALDLAFGPRPIRLAGARREAVVPREVLEARMPQHLACGATQRDRARIVVETAERHAAEVTQGALVAIEQRVEPLVAIGVRHRPSREAEREDEEVDRRRDVGDPDLQLAEIDLRLLPGARLKAHRRSRRPPARRPQRLKRSLHLLIAAGEALRPQLAKQHAPIPAHLRTAPLRNSRWASIAFVYTRGARGRHAPRRRHRLIVFLSTPSSRAIVLTCSPRASRASTSRTTSSRSIQPSTGVPGARVEPTSSRSDRPSSSPSEWRGDFHLIDPGGTFT